MQRSDLEAACGTIHARGLSSVDVLRLFFFTEPDFYIFTTFRQLAVENE